MVTHNQQKMLRRTVNTAPKKEKRVKVVEEEKEEKEDLTLKNMRIVIIKMVNTINNGTLSINTELAQKLSELSVSAFEGVSDEEKERLVNIEDSFADKDGIYEGLNDAYKTKSSLGDKIFALVKSLLQ